MTGRLDLVKALGAVIGTMEREGSRDLPALDKPRYRVNLPAFGGWGSLIAHAPEVHPQAKTAIGYVRLQGDGDNLQAAIWHNGQWCKRSFKPFAKPVELWFHIEGESDG